MIDTDSMALLESEILIIENDGKIAEINITLQTEEEEIFGKIVLPEHVYMGMGIYLSTTGSLALLANLLVVFIFVRTRHLRVATNLQLLNLSLADIGVVVLAYPFAIRSNFAGKWLYGVAGCQWYGFSGFFFGNVSMSTLSLLSFDRYITVCRPNSDYKIRTVKQAVTLLCFIWIEALLFAILPVLGWSKYHLEPFQTSCTVDWYNHSPEAVSFVGCLTLYITINVTIIIVCYGCIAHKVREHGKTNICAKHRKTKPGDQKTAVLIALQVFGFLVCWMPYAVTSLWLSYGSSSKTSLNLTVVLPAMFAKFAPLVNPLIYVAVNYNFRRAFADIARCRIKSKNIKSTESGKCVRVSQIQTKMCLSCIPVSWPFNSNSTPEESV